MQVREMSIDLRAVSQILIKVPFVLAVATYQRVSIIVLILEFDRSLRKYSHHPSLLRHSQADELILVRVDRHWSAAHSLLRCVKINLQILNS